ncbi:MAG: glycosyltransferase family 2 protein [Elusimicrobia bacterium]|nr:glycosyltransferase family 2 protein [Elusimicrobiota bacterium]
MSRSNGKMDNRALFCYNYRMEKNIELSVVIPCRNEEKNIERAVTLTNNYLTRKNIKGEIIVVDDGSEDATFKIAKKLADSIPRPLNVIKLGKNSGKGAAVRKGVLASSGNFVLFTDADFSTDISELDNFLPVAGKDAEIVIASRSLPGSVLDPPQSFFRRAIGTLCRTLVSFLAVKGYKDTQCGFKLFSRKAADTIFPRLKTDGFAFDVEALVLAEKLGFSVKEMPVRWKNSSDSRVNPVKDSFNFFLQLLRGFYKKGDG